MNEIINKDYLLDLNKIKETIRNNQNKAMVIVNSAMIMTYYEIGTIINQRKTWGSKYIEKLSNDLKEYGKGFSRSNLFYMRKIASVFSNDEIVQLPVGQIPWRSIIIIMDKAHSHEEMLWYINETHKRKQHNCAVFYSPINNLYGSTFLIFKLISIAEIMASTIMKIIVRIG